MSEDLYGVFKNGDILPECYVVRGTLSNGKPIISRKFAGKTAEWRTLREAKADAERFARFSKACGGNLVVVRQMLNLETMLWEDADA